MLYIAGDHHGFTAITYVRAYLDEHGIAYTDVGVTSPEQDMPLEEMIPKVTSPVRVNTQNKGILSCGTGVGVEVGANKFSGIRAALATSPKIAEYSVVYDKCNVLCLVGWESDKETVYKILDAWFASSYDGSEKRLAMMKEFDTWH